MNEKLTVGIIGFGKMGSLYLKICQEMEWTISGIVDPNADTKKKLSIKEIEIPFFTDITLMLKTVKPDLLIFSSTTSHRFTEFFRATDIYHPKFVLFEKPMGNSIQKSSQVLQYCQRNNIRFSVNHQMRFMPIYKLMKDLHQKRSYGELLSLNISAANIGLGTNVTHYFEAFRWIFDSSIEEIYAWLDKEKVSSNRGSQFYDFSGDIYCRNSLGKSFFISFKAESAHYIIHVYDFEYAKVIINEIDNTGVVIHRKKEFYDNEKTKYGSPSETLNLSIEYYDNFLTTREVIINLINDLDYPTGVHGLEALKAAIASVYSSEFGGIQVHLDNEVNFEGEFNWP